MIKTFTIDFVRALLLDRLSKNRASEDKFNDNDISLVSFYEHLNSDEEVNRFVETYQEIIGQQNKQDKIGVGIVALTDSPSFTNVKKTTSIAFEWGCQIRCTLENRDKMISTIYDMCEDLKAKKYDIAQLKNGSLIVVGTMGTHLKNNAPSIENGDYIGLLDKSGGKTDIQAINEIFNNLCGTGGLGFVNNVHNGNFFCSKIFEDGTEHLVEFFSKGEDIQLIILKATYGEFEKYKLSISCDDIKMSEPYVLDKDEYCEIIFGGSATLASSNVRLKEDLVQVALKRNKLVGTTTTTYSDNYTFLPTLADRNNELGTNQLTSQIRSNFFLPKNSTDSISIQRDYEFIYDTENEFLNAIYNYAENGVRGTSTSELVISPNMIFTLYELKSSWGKIEKFEHNVKLVESIPTNNNEDSVVSIKISLSIQGE